MQSFSHLDMCAQRGFRSACTFVQSDQNLHCVHFGLPKMQSFSMWICAPSEDSDQPAHSCSLIRILTVCILDYQRCKVFPIWICAPSEDSDQPAHSCSLIRILTVCILDYQRCKVFFHLDMCAQRGFRSACTFVQSDQNLHCVHFGLPKMQSFSMWICAPSEDSDQPAHSCSLIRIFTVCILDYQRCKVPPCGQ